MSRIPLTQGAYTARSLIAACQRSVNLYIEPNPSDSPVPFTHYLTPGTVVQGHPADGVVRCLYRATNGNLYMVVNQAVYAVSAAYAFTQIGTLLTEGYNPVSMADNATVIVIVDGSPNGYTVDMASNAFSQIVSTAFYGADKVDYLDTYFLFNKPGTSIFYSSDSNATTFDPLWFAAKVGYADPLQTLAVMHREIYLIGALTTEVWYNEGGANFPFAIMQGTFIEHGCAAKYSVGKFGNSLFWLSQELEGHKVVVKLSNYQSIKVSTPAIDYEIEQYSKVDDAIGYVYQKEGHPFYVLTFPSADKTWVYDILNNMWHEWVWFDDNGAEHRHRSNCSAFAYGQNLVGDFENGTLYALDFDTYTDAGTIAPITRIRSFPHMMNDGKRVRYTQFIADMQVGTVTGVGEQSFSYIVASDPDPSVLVLSDGGPGFYIGADQALQASSVAPAVSLRWSDTRGASWGNPLTSTLGATGEYLTSIQFQRLGMARDRVFELSWAADCMTALNGAFVQMQPAST
ncbi:MAG TPA: hypothetical protein VN702_17570 [Acetobacteraceae bacterium]|nr:hypothetical protein [Acetobacteraceae bacterium]